MKWIATLFLVGGFVCGLCCFTIHLAGLNDVTLPISVEYAKFNPLAIVFVWVSLLLLAIASYLYYCQKSIVESIVMAIGTMGLFLVAVTDIKSEKHGLALVLAVSSMVIAPTLQALRGEIGLSDVILVAINFSLSFMLIVLAVFAPEFGLGMAERVWFGMGFLSTTWMLDVPGLATGETVSQG